MADRTALVVGARGVVGTNLIEHLAADGSWDVIGLSRRGGASGPGVRHIAADLLDPATMGDIAAELAGVTHVFYAAYQDRPSWSALVAPNVAMLGAVLDAVRAAPRLSHVSLMQGYKVYGAHLGPFKTPAREYDPPHMPPEFNVAQQELLEDRQRGSDWTWTAIRPSVVSGTALGNPMNLAMVIAVYASLSKELRVPLRFPGSPGAYTSLPTEVRAIQMSTPFRVRFADGVSELEGRPGDWLLDYGNGSLGVVSADVFADTYDLA